MIRKLAPRRQGIVQQDRSTVVVNHKQPPRVAGSDGEGVTMDVSFKLFVTMEKFMGLCVMLKCEMWIKF